MRNLDGSRMHSRIAESKNFGSMHFRASGRNSDQFTVEVVPVAKTEKRLSLTKRSKN
jgi:hypothetical protein